MWREGKVVASIGLTLAPNTSTVMAKKRITTPTIVDTALKRGEMLKLSFTQPTRRSRPTGPPMAVSRITPTQHSSAAHVASSSVLLKTEQARHLLIATTIGLRLLLNIICHVLNVERL